MNTGKDKKSSHYIHGSSSQEQHRLSLMNTLLNSASLQELGPLGGERVLDVGSGLGQFTRAIARAVGSKGYVLGIEREAQQLKEAIQQAYEDGGEKLVEFRQGDALKLPMWESEWGYFDIVLARFLLEHISNPMGAVSEMVKAVRPGGRIVLMDDDHANFRLWPEPVGFHSLWQAYVRLYDRFGNDPYVGRRLVSILHDSGVKEIRNTCVFFGGCSGNPIFPSVVDNLIGVLEGAREAIVSEGLLNSKSFFNTIDNIREWGELPQAALWYAACWAEGKYHIEGNCV